MELMEWCVALLLVPKLQLGRALVREALLRQSPPADRSHINLNPTTQVSGRNLGERGMQLELRRQSRAQAGAWARGLKDRIKKRSPHRFFPPLHSAPSGRRQDACTTINRATRYSRYFTCSRYWMLFGNASSTVGDSSSMK